MDLLAQARADQQKYTQGEFSSEVTFVTPNGLTTVTVDALASKHHLSIDPSTGISMIAKNTHVSVSESVLNAAGYTTRNAARDVDLRNHKVSYADSTGVIGYYLVNEVMPSDTFGLITLILGDYNNG